MRTVDRCLTAQLFEHLRRSCETITRLSDRDVQNQLVDSQFPHGVGALVFAFRHLDLCVKMMGLTIETEYAMRVELGSRDVEVGAGILEVRGAQKTWRPRVSDLVSNWTTRLAVEVELCDFDAPIKMR